MGDKRLERIYVIRRQPQEKFKVDESCNVLEPNSLSRIPIVENIETVTDFRKASGTRAQPHYHPLARRICAFSNEISLTGEVLPVPDCRVRSDGAGCRKWDTKNTNPFRLFTYREYLVPASLVLLCVVLPRDIFHRSFSHHALLVSRHLFVKVYASQALWSFHLFSSTFVASRS